MFLREIQAGPGPSSIAHQGITLLQEDLHPLILPLSEALAQAEVTTEAEAVPAAVVTAEAEAAHVPAAVAAVAAVAAIQEAEAEEGRKS